MSIITLPYVFVGGTRAIADQVNADFNAVANGINNNVIAQLQTNPTNFYVNGATGNDSNNGLTPTTAFLTLQGASNAVGFMNLNGVQVIVNIAAGNYAGFSWGGAILGQYSPGQVVFRGDVANPANVIVGPGLPGSGSGQCVFVITSGMLQLEGMRFTNPTSDPLGLMGNGIWAQEGAQVHWQACDFGPCTSNHVVAEDFALVSPVGAYTISGSAGRHYFIGGQAQLAAGAISGVPVGTPFTVTLTGGPAFPNSFIYCTGNSLADFGGTVHGAGSSAIVTFSGAATGARYAVNVNSSILTYGGGANYFPGDQAGSADASSFGVYA